MQDITTKLQELIHHYQQDFSRPNELHRLMQKSAEQLTQLPFPHRKLEAWKYTNIKDLFAANMHLEKVSGKMSKIVTKDIPATAVHFVFVNGKLSKLLSKNLKLVKFIHLDPFSDIHFVEQGTVAFNLNNTDFCSTLNLATLKEGLQILIDANYPSARPLIFTHVFTADCQGNIISPRIAIEVAKGQKVNIVEHFQYKGLQDSSFTLNNVTELTIEEQAKVEYVQLQNTSTPTLHFNTISANLYDHAQFHLTNLTYGGRLTRNNFLINLHRPGAIANVNGLFKLTDQQHSDQFIQINHYAPHTDSHQLFKGILDQKARGVFTGQVHVAKDAILVNSTQQNKNLLLSSNARVDTRPQLEIYADDVKCTHGATIGQLNDDEVFYLETRGIPPEKAKEMVAKGFGEEVILRIPNPTIIDLVSNLIS